MIPFFEFTQLPISLNLPLAEAQRSSLSVAALCGVVAAVVVSRLRLPAWASAILGFVVSSAVCHYGFPVAHEWYGGGTIWHRCYDLSGIGSAWLMHQELNRK